MDGIEVRELVPSEYKEWDLIVEKAKSGTLFHTSEWLEICRDALSIDLKIYGCFRNGELVGGCPLFVKNIKGILKVATSTCRMTSYSGPLIKENASSRASKRVQETHEILNPLREFLCKQGFDSIHLTFSPGFEDIRPFTWNGWDSAVHYTHYLNLQENIDRNLSGERRMELKTATEAGLRTRAWNDPETYYRLLSLAYDKQNIEPPLPREFFERLFKLIREKNIGYMFVSETSEGEAVAAHLNLYGKKCAVIWTSTLNPDFDSLGPYALLYYNEFLDLKSRDFKFMNVMAANVPTFVDFIMGFSPELIPYYSVNLDSKRYSIAKILYKTTHKETY
ncbi:GNAT family N-acetyltransferase [Methanosarcina hadiensis]|uniref:GNAT family N-acetyltransferase n=1 Tax=Methanosarcina hadiensis TaxID=3078083 RepID=UPI003977C563